MTTSLNILENPSFLRISDVALFKKCFTLLKFTFNFFSPKLKNLTTPPPSIVLRIVAGLQSVVSGKKRKGILLGKA